MIRTIPHPVSEGLRQENEVHERLAAEYAPERLRRKHPTAATFLEPFLAGEEGLQYTRALAEVRPGSRILDIGAGYGRSSIYLASLGHRVSVAEPSIDLCRGIEAASEQYGLPLDIYQVAAEYLDRLPARGFDACVFNASLHHCDDPAQALAHCHALLAPGGKVFLLNEPLLPFFRSKAWFHRQVEDNTLVTGHYGGNEHTYYRHEYVAMLRAARFGEVRDALSLRYLRPERYLCKIEQRGAGRRRVAARSLYYGTIRGLCRSGVLGRPVLGLLKRLSLLQVYFIATKSAAA